MFVCGVRWSFSRRLGMRDDGAPSDLDSAPQEIRLWLQHHVTRQIWPLCGSAKRAEDAGKRKLLWVAGGLLWNGSPVADCVLHRRKRRTNCMGWWITWADWAADTTQPPSCPRRTNPGMSLMTLKSERWAMIELVHWWLRTWMTHFDVMKCACQWCRLEDNRLLTRFTSMLSITSVNNWDFCFLMTECCSLFVTLKLIAHQLQHCISPGVQREGQR